MSLKKPAVGLFSALAISVPLAVGCANRPTISSEPQPTARPTGTALVALPQPSFAKSGGTASLPDVVQRVLPSIVNVATARTRVRPSGMFDDPMLRRFFGPSGQPSEEGPQRREEGLGSGVVVDKGIILTNNHVVDGADEIQVTTADKHEYEVQVVGTDPKSDLAVLRVKGDASALVPIAMGDSARLRLGDTVLAIGNPFGVGQTVTMGIVSAKGRANVGIVDYEDFIQTDAAINPGNSGGALVDLEGNLVGIPTAILSRTGGSMGVGFAIPTNMAKPIVQSLLAHGKVVRGWLGVGIQDITPELSAAMKLASTEGVLVSEVQRGSPAEKAGLQRGDVILSVDGRKVSSTGELRNLVAAAGANVQSKVEIARNGQRQALSVKLGETPGEPKGRQSGQAAPGSGQGRLDGLALEDLNAMNRQRFEVPGDVKQGIVVSGIEPGSTAARSGLRPGDVIVEVNRQRVATLSDFEREWKRGKGPALVVVSRGGTTLFVVVRR